MNDAQLVILKNKLASDFVPHLPALLDTTKPADQVQAKNVSRALPAFCLHKHLTLDPIASAKAVVDDYDDNGLDAIYYHQASKTLFLVQGKLKATEPFQQAEAQAFVAGVRDLLNQRYDRFNANLLNRQAELEDALDDASEIKLLVVHASSQVSQHAKDVIENFLRDEKDLDERLQSDWIDYGPERLLVELLDEHAVTPVDDELTIYGEKKIDAPRVTYYGQVSLKSLVDLYVKHGNRLFEKNIRYFLGIASSGVNRAIHETLETRPADFFYLSNGVTAIAHEIEPRAARNGGRRYEVKGLSIINGAQTVASSHHFTATKPGASIDDARVLLTLIQVPPANPFSSDITRARNHQNPVSTAQFAALDNIQERLRRELAFFNIVYRYRPESRDTTPGVDLVTIDEAAIALALFDPDPAMPVTLKREPSRLLNSSSAEYTKLFNAALSGARLANSVRLYRKALTALVGNELAAGGTDKLIYRHGRNAILWLVMRANAAWLDRTEVMSNADAATLISVPLDTWREKVRTEATAELATALKGPLAFFRNLTNTRPFVVRLRDAGV